MSRFHLERARRSASFQDYPDVRLVERWKRMVPENFTLTVRRHQAHVMLSPELMEYLSK